MICINCGAELKVGAKFCGKCGTQIKSQEINQTQDINLAEQ